VALCGPWCLADMAITCGNAPMTPATDGLRWRLNGPSPGRAPGVKTSIPDKNPAAAKATRRVRPGRRAAGQDPVDRGRHMDTLNMRKISSGSVIARSI
jgi:hypothetical protein